MGTTASIFDANTYASLTQFLERVHMQVKAWSKKSETTYVATPAQSWIDDFFSFSITDVCCNYNKVSIQKKKIGKRCITN